MTWGWEGSNSEPSLFRMCLHPRLLSAVISTARARCVCVPCSHLWLLSPGEVSRVTEGLCFKFPFLFMRFNLNSYT